MVLTVDSPETHSEKLIEYQSNNPYDEIFDALASDFIKYVLDEKFLGKVAKSTTSKEALKILEEEFGARGSDMQQQDVSKFIESATNMRVDKQEF